MQEVTISLRFTRPCLGAARRPLGKNAFRMDRGADDKIMILPSAWQGVIRYAAQVANRHHALVRKIDWSPLLSSGPATRTYRRSVVGSGHYVTHEAFLADDQISLTAVLPDGLPLADFSALLEIAGAYRGVSPYHNQTEKYGTFVVVSVSPCVRSWVAPEVDPSVLAAECKREEPAGG